MAEESVPLMEVQEDLGNPVPIILGVVGTLVVAFILVNVVLWYQAQKLVGPRKAKKVGAKKIKREAAGRGLQVLGD